MANEEYKIIEMEVCRALVAKYVNENLPSDMDRINAADVYVVWFNKTLDHGKALLSTNLPDGMYYEVTYNGIKDEYYFDAYKRTENKTYVKGDVF